MTFFKSALVICAFIVGIQAAKLPDYIPQCRKDLPAAEFGKCMTKSANIAIKKFSGGDASIHLLPLEPLHVPKMLLNVDGNLKIDVTDADIHGISNINMNDVEWDFDKKHVMMKFNCPLADLIGTYDIDGRILILPIKGNGPCNITFVEGDYVLYFDYELEEKGSKHYLKLTSNKLTYTLKRAYFGLDNLFGGDERLGSEMKKFLDENWKEVNGEIGTQIGNGLGEVYAAVIQGMFGKLSMEELFG